MKTLAIILFLAGFLACGPAGAAGSGGIDIQFLWATCPQVGEFGMGMGDAVEYLVWERHNGGVEKVVATTTDTTVTLTVVPDVTVEVRVQGIDAAGIPSVKSDWSEPLYYESGSGAGDLPREAFLKPNSPNPFNPETTISYRVPEDLQPGQPMDLAVFSVRGQKVRTLMVDGTPGWHQVRWDGRDDRGEPASSGIYLTRYLVGTMVETGKMTLVK